MSFRVFKMAASMMKFYDLHCHRYGNIFKIIQVIDIDLLKPPCDYEKSFQRGGGAGGNEKKRRIAVRSKSINNFIFFIHFFFLHSFPGTLPPLGNNVRVSRQSALPFLSRFRNRLLSSTIPSSIS